MLSRFLQSSWKNQHFALLPNNDDVEEFNGKDEVESLNPAPNSLLRRIDQRTWQLVRTRYLPHILGAQPYSERPEFGDCGEQGSLERPRRQVAYLILSLLSRKPKCYDAELAAEFVGKINHKFYRNETQTAENEVPLEERHAGDRPYILRDESTTICIAITLGEAAPSVSE
ncbi:hypothetical protein EPUS_08361 [Endocarpon pusillum Z07020]|uniref:Uncharacterized protein n=1 Tax=Endocarpon pusillum (strain Z07020 / HMAS-L-300199) TaxID=1263415 RepID=U1HUD4_ENDPU|nr:uncharacterized protein EPUS_08361 [Endocarpon pusillum Z07020]ERF72914.1 hypothetical protein EPUS_08361 [Endocarpon pusillum Z07020]